MKFDPPSSADSEILDLARRKGWPQDMRELLQRYPREQWQGHANLGEMATFWLQRHAMFRELAGMVEGIADDFRGGALTVTQFPQLFVSRLQFLLQQLDVHHQIEDIHYFPIFRAADNKLARGFDVLEEDHHAIHAGMAETAETANALLCVLHGDANRLRRCGDDYAVVSGQLLRFLMRHLDDEEDLIVPLILDRGEVALGVRHL